MAHQDQGRKNNSFTHARQLFVTLGWLLTGMSTDAILLRQDCTWTVQGLMYAAILWSWSDEKTLLDRFAIARKIIMFCLPGQQQPAKSYQAFVKLLRTWTDPLIGLLKEVFRRRMQELLAGVWMVAGFAVFACDGSRVDVPRTRKNEERYSSKSKLSRTAQKRRRQAKRRRTQRLARARKANVPHIWLTVMWHVGSGLPWDWRTGPAGSSERKHLEEMMASLPPGSLITADAGFVGYELWKRIIAAGHHLLVRVGGNVRLLKKLGYVREKGGLVYLWPDSVAKKHQPPLVLRLAVVSGKRHPIYLVTSIMASSRLSEKQMAEVYRHRWGIEVFYRHCKQTFERRKLRSQNPDNAMVELQWSLAGVWAMGLHSHCRLVRRGVPPEKISFVGVLRAYRRCMREYKSQADPDERLEEMLDRAIIDSYHRKNKTSRDYPRKKEEKAAGSPIILKATRTQIRMAKEVKIEHQKGLTA
jgi:hypothetical protein